MATNPTELFSTGLRNAHAMEVQALSIMRPQLQRIENYPMVAARLEEHIRETEQQIGRLKELLDQRDADESRLKDAALSVAGTMAAVAHVFTSDEILKNAFANYAFENYEIAAYRSLIALAELAGEARATQLLTQNLDEEEAMAGWIVGHLEQLTIDFASREQLGAPAKR